MLRSLAWIFVFYTVAFAASIRRTDRVVHERRAMEPTAWLKSHRLDADKILPLRFGLKQQNMHRLDELLMSVAHPESSTYGQHWSPEQVLDFFSPSDETIAAVKEWLNDFGFNHDRVRLSSNKGWLEVNASVAEAEELLSAEYHVYSHPSG